MSAVVSLFGASDFILRAKSQPDSTNEPGSVVYELLGGPPGKNTSLARAASPAWHVGDEAPPLLLFQGAQDTYVLLDQALRMHQAYRDVGRPVVLHVKEDAGHRIGDFMDVESLGILREFLHRHLGDRADQAVP